MASLADLLAQMAPNPLVSLDERLAGMKARMPQPQVEAPVAPGLQSLLAPYNSAVTAAPTTFTGPDLQSLVQQIQGAQGGGGGGWMPQGGSGKIVTKNGIGMAAPAMRSLMQLKNALGAKPLANASGGFRTHAQQVALWKAHQAGTHPAAVARPGTSLHEKGLAIDFNTDWITAPAQRDVRRWLLNHGWHNDVPGEPWHWSYGESG